MNSQNMMSQEEIKFQSVEEWENRNQKLSLLAENFKSNFEIQMLSAGDFDHKLNITIFAISFDNSAQQDYEKNKIIQEKQTLK